MIEKHPISEAAENLPSIVESVGNGTTVHLTGEDGHTVAVMMSLGEYHRLKYGFTPKGDFKNALEKFRAEVDLEELNIEEVYADVRDKSPDGK